ncbi:hypothetical protein ACE1ET_13685 [Saccharicrinis sp. FJH62]|uniref:hypothetical protein n=1 Tax=Saccharicrinis sp. FJH62 TaxID=3344657 RepID=UPI0035D490ED
MRNLVLIVVILFFSKSYSQEYYFANDDCVLNNQFTGYTFINIIRTLDENTKYVEQDEKIGEIAEFPKIQSENYQENIDKSVQYYLNGEYYKAAEELKKPFKKEPDNLFITFNYARALYWIEDDNSKENSFKIYKDFVYRLDSINGKSDSTITIDFWFRESYWKLATLYMDYNDWSNAAQLINRFILGIQDFKGTPVYVQSLEYLTECYFNMYDDKLAKYFAERTLYYDSNNKYVKDILKKIKQE